MATLDKAEALLEDLRSASWDAAVKDLDEVKAFAAKQVRPHHLLILQFPASLHPAAKKLLLHCPSQQSTWYQKSHEKKQICLALALRQLFSLYKLPACSG